MAPSIYHSLLLPDLQLMLIEQDHAAMREFCDALHPGVAAEVLEGLEPNQAWEVLSHCTALKQAEIFAYFSLPAQVAMVDSIGEEPLSRIIEEMSADDRVDLLERMDPDHVERLLRFVAQAERADIRKLLSYPEGSAGSIMTTEYTWLPSDINVQEALERLRLQAPTRETIYYIYVTDESRHLIGFVSLGKLIQARLTAKISDLMQRDVISVRVDDDQEFAAQETLKYGFIAIPVVDNQHRLVGIITHDDAAEVIQEEAAEDAYLAGGMTPLEDSYVETPFFELAWKRGMWLVILLGAASLTAQVLNHFEHQDAMNWMVLFLPMVLASGGNAGSQSATLMIRALAMDETEGRVKWIAWREIRIGALLGLVLAVVSSIVARLMVGGEASYVVGLTVFLVVAAGTFFGAMLPLSLKRLGLDPAFMSNPLIAALSDMLGVVIYYNAARGLVGLL
ncbi:magnesium transporter [Planctomicrobium sp. SH661]|uniref:magnesium transporter n=1 Tax=Planctomicrobium sp. SH661 TaxID=3448124 RepID=UPI003F5B229A